MEATELRALEVAELRDELMRLRKEHFNLRMQRASGQLGQTHLLAETRRDIARVKMVMGERANG